MTTHHNTQSLQGDSSSRLDDIRAELIGDLHFNTKPEEIELPRIKRRAQYIHDITQHDFDWFVTLTFRYKKTDHDEVVLLAKKFFDLLSGEIYGKRSKKRIIHYSAIERHKDGSLHIHAVIKQPKSDNPVGAMEMQDLIKRNWYEVASTNLDISSSGNDLERYSYLTLLSERLVTHMRQTTTVTADFQVAFNKYPATWFPTAFTRDAGWPHLINLNSLA